MLPACGALALVSLVMLGRPGPASATNECRALNPCVPVAGPWVVVPTARTLPRPQVQFQLTCPRGFVVAGLDAELSDRAIDLAFLGNSGSPIAPGITTSRTVVFVAWFAGSRPRAPSFRPHAGCVPGSGGGGRTSTAAKAFFSPGQPVIRRVVTVRVLSARRVIASCRTGERLVGWYAARGFVRATPPSPGLAAAVSVTTRLHGAQVTAVTRARAAGAVVQLAALCAGGT